MPSVCCTDLILHPTLARKLDQEEEETAQEKREHGAWVRETVGHCDVIRVVLAYADEATLCRFAWVVVGGETGLTSRMVFCARQRFSRPLLSPLSRPEPEAAFSCFRASALSLSLPPS